MSSWCLCTAHPQQPAYACVQQMPKRSDPFTSVGERVAKPAFGLLGLGF